MEKSKFLDSSIGLDEIVTLHYGLSYIGGIITLQKRAKKFKYMYSKVGHFWCWLAQAEPNATSSEKLLFQPKLILYGHVKHIQSHFRMFKAYIRSQPISCYIR
jgi:hypothetical protein